MLARNSCIVIASCTYITMFPSPIPGSDSEGSGALLTPQIPPESRPNDVSDDGSGDDSIFATLLVAVVITMIVMGGLIILCLLGVCTVCIIMYFRRNRLVLYLLLILPSSNMSQC